MAVRKRVDGAYGTTNVSALFVFTKLASSYASNGAIKSFGFISLSTVSAMS